MRSKQYIIILTSVLLIVFTAGCKKEKEKLPPVISFKMGSSYTQNGDVVMVGHRLYFGIQATGVSEVLTNFTIKKTLDDGTVITVLDSGLYASDLDVNKILYQNVESKVTWTFAVMDRNRMSAEISLVVNKDPNSTFGGIYYYPSLKLGYQNNLIYGHFASPAGGRVYFNDSASLLCNQIDILTYYIVSDGLPSPVLSSPSEMDNASLEAQTYYPFIANWQPRNYTLWDISVDNTPVTASAFEQAHNDSLLIVSYHDVWGKKKFRWATAGRVIPFLTAGGKKGLIKVINADEVDNGAMEIAVKIQQ
ncbi:MAG: hypothetical protein WCM76_16090 [Bacteroidota bacterium]